MLVLALDLGTSSVRAALFGADGRRHLSSTVQQTYPLRTAADGMAELDPQEVLAATRACLIGALAKRQRTPALRRQAVVAVGVSSFWHGLMGTDAEGRPLTPILTWADSRCCADAAQLRAHYDEADYHSRTGCMLRASFWPAKLAWLRRAQPRVWRQVARWWSPADWMQWRLLGGDPLALATAHGMATGTGLYDPTAMTWAAEPLLAAGLDLGQVPVIRDEPMRVPSSALGGLLSDALWFPAIGDGAANNLGVGATEPNVAAINFGTSGAIRVVQHGGAQTPLGLFRYRIDTQRSLVGGAISNAGGLRQWCLDTLRLPAAAGLEAAMAARPQPSPHLGVLPFWLAERAPTWREDLSGAIIGLRQSTTALDLYQAITEATYQRLATILDRLPTRGRLRVIVGGGIQHSPAAVQRLADCLGVPLIISGEPETSLRGAAVLALERLGARRLTPELGQTVRPRAAMVGAYAQQRRMLAALEKRLLP